MPGPQQHKKEHDPTAHVMDYPALDLGNKHCSKTHVAIVDLDVYVWGLEEIKGSKLPIAAVIASHGRCNSAKNMEPFARGLLAAAKEEEKALSGRKKTHDLVVITLDHRNHGQRTKYRETNLAYDKNWHHFIDMAATIYGATQDYDMIMRFLNPYLFPKGEREITEWMATGISLGGNTVWRLLREDPRIRVAVPIIGLPFEAFGPYLGARAEQGGLAFAPPIYPSTLRPYIESPRPEGAYKGRKILSIHGEIDELVPYRFGKETIAEIQKAAPEGEVDVFVEQGKGHVCTPEMLRRAAAWFYRWGCTEP